MVSVRFLVYRHSLLRILWQCTSSKQGRLAISKAMKTHLPPANYLANPSSSSSPSSSFSSSTTTKTNQGDNEKEKAHLLFNRLMRMMSIYER